MHRALRHVGKQPRKQASNLLGYDLSTGWATLRGAAFPAWFRLAFTPPFYTRVAVDDRPPNSIFNKDILKQKWGEWCHLLAPSPVN